MTDDADWYRRIVENFPDEIVFLYENGDDLRYTFVGGEGLAEIGLTKESLEGNRVAAGRPPEIRDTIRSRYRRALDGERVTFETELEGRHYRIRLLPVSDERDTGIGIAKNITEQVAYREELRRQNERLEGFTDLVFHDIRNPLNVAQERLELLREECECDGDHVDSIAGALDRIESLTEEKPSVTGGLDEDAGPVDLGSIARKAWQNVATGAAELRVETDRIVRADGDDLRRLFENLYRNSVEHGSTGSRPGADDSVEHGSTGSRPGAAEGRAGGGITVTVGSLEDGFYVADDGSGLPETGPDDLFGRGVSTGSGGSGLGLFIVGRVAERHGWEVTATESAAGGARLEFTGVEI
jgi:PAS domain S-box-containing protein